MKLFRHLAYLGGMAVLALYVLNPGAGVFELIPDNLPVVGNLDEAAAVALFITVLKRWRAGSSPLPPSEPEASE